MKTYFTTVTRKGQITIPVEIRRVLELEEGDKIAVQLEGDKLRLWPTEGVVARTAGMLSGEGPKLTAEEEREKSERLIAEEAVQRSGGG